MNYFYKRHLWLLPLCIVAIWGMWAAQVVSAQANPVDITVSSDGLPTTFTDIITVTITYTVTEPTQLFYYPPADFVVVSDDGATAVPDVAPPPDLNGAGRLQWEVADSGTKVVGLRVQENAVPGQKPHRVALNEALIDEVLTLSTPVAEVVPAQSTNPDLQIISAAAVPQLVEPGQPFTVTAVIQNSGEIPANDVKMNLTPDSTVFLGLRSFPVGAIETGKPIPQSYQISTGEDTADGQYTLTVRLLNGEIEYDSKPVTITVNQSPQIPALELFAEDVYGSDPGKRGLRLEFRNNGAALPADAQLVLRYPENALSVNQALLNGANDPGAAQADGGGHAWSNLPPIDWRTEDTFVLDITEMVINPGFTTGTNVQISFVDSSGGSLAPQVSLAPDTIAKLAEGVLAPTVPPPTPTIEKIAPVIESTIAPTDGDSSEIGEPTAVPEDNEEGENSNLLQRLLIGVIVVAVLVLVVIGIYLLLNSRRQAKPNKGGILPSSTSGQPYLTSNGRSFPITTFPFTIGRGEGNNLIIDETFPQWQSMSRNHARIVQHQQGYVIEDMGSQNKLRVQGRLTERNLLRNGWQVLIGGVEFTFYDGSVSPGGSA